MKRTAHDIRIEETAANTIPPAEDDMLRWAGLCCRVKVSASIRRRFEGVTQTAAQRYKIIVVSKEYYLQYKNTSINKPNLSKPPCNRIKIRSVDVSYLAATKQPFNIRSPPNKADKISYIE